MAFDPGTATFRLRIKIDKQSAGATSGSAWQLRCSKNSGAYQQVSTSSTFGVKSADASSDADETKILIPRLS